MKNFHLIQKNINIEPFIAEIAQQNTFWSTTRAKVVKVQRETLTISLRTGVREEGKIIEDSQTIVSTKLYPFFPHLTQWVEQFVEPRGTLSRLMVVSLQPGGKVYPHIDHGAYYKIRDRYHLVLQSREGSIMVSGEEEQVFKEGEAWWFNNKVMHEVMNPSSYPRIHVIFDILPKGHL